MNLQRPPERPRMSAGAIVAAAVYLAWLAALATLSIMHTTGSL